MPSAELSKIRGRLILGLCAFACLVVPELHAQELSEQSLPLDAELASDGRSITLSWYDTPRAHRGAVTVKRRILGQTGGDSWQTIASAAPRGLRYTDDQIEPGTAYEYQVLRSGRELIDVGYWTAGTEIPAIEDRGWAYVIVDDTLADGLQPHLSRFLRDLTGDGWRPVLQRAPRHVPNDPLTTLKGAAAVKKWLTDAYARDPFARHAVILVGHVPVVTSGRAAPDGHKAVPHATDLFYAELDGRWRARPDGQLLENALPSDVLEMQIGRIDFANLSGGSTEEELRLLRAYFDKNHHWRQGFLGDIRAAYGANGALLVERYGLRNIVGPEAVREGGHHDVGEERPWLWGVDFGDWNGRRYADAYANKAVFAINFGSSKQKFADPFNAMTTLLAQPWYNVAVGWGARPAWWLHHMALGGTIGDVHMRTVNNGQAKAPYQESMDYFPTGLYLWRNPVWVNLLGDPTLRAFMLSPPTHLRVEKADQGLMLSWRAAPHRDVLGYRVYRAAPGETMFAPLTPDTLVEGTRFTDISAPEGAVRYMVRAYGLRSVYAGSFYTYSQGAFGALDWPVLAADELRVSTPEGAPVPLPVDGAGAGGISALIQGAKVGTLTRGEAGWQYTPPPGFAGEVRLRYAISDALQTDQSELIIEVGPE